MRLYSRLRDFLSPERRPLQAEIRNETRSTVLAEAADVADSAAARNIGLLKRKNLLPGQGLWLVPCSAVHSFGMSFEIDLVYMNRKHQVRKVRRIMKAARLSVCFGGHSVLELPAGTVAKTGTKPGDQLRVLIRRAQTQHL